MGCLSSLVGLANTGASGAGSAYLWPWSTGWGPLKVAIPGSTWAGLENDGASTESDPLFSELVDFEGMEGCT